MWVSRITPWLLALSAPVSAATLERMSLDEMIEASTAIVRGRAAESRTVGGGPILYTLTRFYVLEQWKGEPTRQLEIALPGGSLNGFSQHFGGVPRLMPGSEFVVFLWRGSTGLNHVVGLSQGLFDVASGDDAKLVVRRAAAADLVLEPGSGKPVENPAIEMSLGSLAARISRVAGIGQDLSPGR